ncbi:hypothetical protein PGT21_006069 [Puccinia graminis f. sp. tritici]|uniref:Uncharacterized protein n=1 Tax=Puccinia graminis f. sp. tritici TaxID=56615 RepID=A0A5B0N6I8_PUCGR|nr:hypothetical protein PGT21_006069 [Puccinia graminis f. sp. tritici]KAA1122893.1 hypothetical protein PGTUg99_010994 [Puccinia graminis f. sp. tritici]
MDQNKSPVVTPGRITTNRFKSLAATPHLFITRVNYSPWGNPIDTPFFTIQPQSVTFKPLPVVRAQITR